MKLCVVSHFFLNLSPDSDGKYSWAHKFEQK